MVTLQKQHELAKTQSKINRKNSKARTLNRENNAYHRRVGTRLYDWVEDQRKVAFIAFELV